MRVATLSLLLLALPAMAAELTCPPVAIYSPCELVLEIPATAAHPNPYLTVQLEAEIRSPRHHTFLMPAFWDGGRRMVIRFSPTEAGDWDFRLTSNIPDFDGKLGKFSATPAETPGFVRTANVRHFMTVENARPHLWMGDTNYRFAFMDRALFEKLADARAEQKFNHLRGLVIGGPADSAKAFSGPDNPNPDYFREVDQRVQYLNRRGITADLMLAGGSNHLASLFPQWQQRERYIRYLVARYAAMNITWDGVQAFEEYANGRGLMKEAGALLKKLDPYGHPRSTGTQATSAPLLPDGWMDFVSYHSPDDQLGAIEHQFYASPAVNGGFGFEDSGAGGTQGVDADTFRRRLWNAWMNGQYVVYGNTGTGAGETVASDAKHLQSPGANQMTHWFDFASRTRWWDLEPFFDVDGGRALALEGIEYIIYVEKPVGPIEVLTLKHSYDVAWFNPVTGEFIKQKKDFKGEKFVGEPPDRTHDWVLHISRDGKIESMNRSYKFESRPVPIQEIEQSPQRVPYEIAEPAGDEISLSKPVKFAAKVKRETRATRAMMYLWTGDLVVAGQGYRVLGTGREGTFRIPEWFSRNVPGVLNLRVSALNANGKAYAADRVYRVTP